MYLYWYSSFQLQINILRAKICWNFHSSATQEICLHLSYKDVFKTLKYIVVLFQHTHFYETKKTLRFVQKTKSVKKKFWQRYIRARKGELDGNFVLLVVESLTRYQIYSSTFA